MHLHHINILCKDRHVAVNKLKNLYGFKGSERIPKFNGALKRTCFLLKQSNIYLTVTEDSTIHADTVDDIAFCVDSVNKVCEEAESVGSEVIEKPHTINYQVELGQELNNNCSYGPNSCIFHIEKAVIKSPIGNLRHTVFSKNSGIAYFLPDMEDEEHNSDIKNPTLNFVDHIAFALPQNTTPQFMAWYSKVFGFSRFCASTTESKQGLVLKANNGNGLKMLTLENHPCMNTGAAEITETEFEQDGLKIVFCESLKDEGSDQIQTFLRNHNGPGVQHIAFNTSSILSDANIWLKNGVYFLNPPAKYYAEIERTLERVKEKHDVKIITDIGILIDHEKLPNSEGYLYQIFTKPVFDSNTFFFELIQRDNARGFGAGNISALWRAVAVDLNESEVEAP